jgi:hypothetical protein
MALSNEDILNAIAEMSPFQAPHPKFAPQAVQS